MELPATEDEIAATFKVFVPETGQLREEEEENPTIKFP
jgi:hypothetical protein